MSDDLKAMSHEDFRRYVLLKYASLFPQDFEEIKAKSYAYQYLPECEAGWYPLIDQALSGLEELLRQEGWLGRAYLRQIKEKFGSLRIYVRPDEAESWPDDIAEGIARIRMDVEDRSGKICEICGEPGRIEVISNYHQCLCAIHVTKRLQWIADGSPDREWR